MKQFITTLLMFSLLAGVITGCGMRLNTKKTEEAAESTAGFEKAQKVEWVSPDGTVLRTLTEKDEITAFVTALDIENWSWTEDGAPDAAAELEIVLYQQPTAAVFGSSDPDRPMEEIARITLREGAETAKVDMMGIPFYASLPDGAMEYLHEQIT